MFGLPFISDAHHTSLQMSWFFSAVCRTLRFCGLSLSKSKQLLYLVHFRALIALNKPTSALLFYAYHSANIVLLGGPSLGSTTDTFSQTDQQIALYYPNMFRRSKVHFQGVQLIYFHSQINK
jgi:hypothetical protein